jgi:hypothetical protein
LAICGDVEINLESAYYAEIYSYSDKIFLMKKLALLLGIFALLLFAGSAKATTYTCDSCDSCQSAVYSATNGDTVKVTSDITYPELTDYSGACVHFNISVEFDCQGYSITKTNVSQIAYSSATSLSVDADDVMIKNCQINGSDGKQWDNGLIFRLYISDAKNLTIIDSAFYDIQIYDIYSGTLTPDEGGLTLQNVTFGRSMGLGALFCINNILINDSTFYDKDIGFNIHQCEVFFDIYPVTNVTITNSRFYNNSNGIELYGAENVNIYNNFFNNTNNLNIGSLINDFWNTTVINATNIIGGNQIGGNYWAYPNGTGYSETCDNANNDSFCDSEYTIASADYLPLTNNWTMIADITPPTITITSPQNISYSTTNIALDVSADEAIDTWWYSLNGGSNATFTPNISITASQGSNDIIAYANDTSGNEGSSQVYFFVDSIAPSIDWNTPSNNSFTDNSSEIDWNVSLSETPDTCLISINGSNATMTIDGLYCYYNILNLTNATTYCAEVYANDSLGNFNVSATQCATINLTEYIPPTPPASSAGLSGLLMFPFNYLAGLALGLGMIFLILGTLYEVKAEEIVRNPEVLFVAVIAVVIVAVFIAAIF